MLTWKKSYLGYRHVSLVDGQGKEFIFSKLFVKISYSWWCWFESSQQVPKENKNAKFNWACVAAADTEIPVSIRESIRLLFGDIGILLKQKKIYLSIYIDERISSLHSVSLHYRFFNNLINIFTMLPSVSTLLNPPNSTSPSSPPSSSSYSTSPVSPIGHHYPPLQRESASEIAYDQR
jgi:hypothetical protein